MKERGPAKSRSAGPDLWPCRLLVTVAIGSAVAVIAVAVGPVIVAVGPIVGPVAIIRIVAPAAIVVAGLLNRLVRDSGTIDRQRRHRGVGLAGNSQQPGARQNGAQYDGEMTHSFLLGQTPSASQS